MLADAERAVDLAAPGKPGIQQATPVLGLDDERAERCPAPGIARVVDVAEVHGYERPSSHGILGERVADIDA
ncbi:hypothetical protein GCM10007368_26510 [Isoptericola cucumis]|uniref:Uncharacterized protein n=1 Tax=Isoptericola cucumis TaxID=1776856 RepID=A0ABQ2B706_9MICO|nr:hypothetical protein GCM10007368_26510 [Isoptericola cucumis]